MASNDGGGAGDAGQALVGGATQGKGGKPAGAAAAENQQLRLPGCLEESLRDGPAAHGHSFDGRRPFRYHHERNRGHVRARVPDQAGQRPPRGGRRFGADDQQSGVERLLEKLYTDVLAAAQGSLARQTREIVDHAVRVGLGDTADVAVEPVVSSESAVRALLRESESAQLLVLGSRGLVASLA